MSPPLPAEQDTIAAISTAPGEAGIAIVRVSGAAAFDIADRIFRPASPPPSQWPPNTFKHGYVCDEHGEQDLDEVVLLIFRPPRSYTRENVIEIQGHGGRLCAQRILRRVLAGGARPAEPGEFTRRAFMNGRIDLLQAEAVMDLIQSHSERAAEAAVQQLEGRLSDSFTKAYDSLITVAADVEATLNFEDDELPSSVTGDLVRRLEAVRHELNRLLETWEEGHLLREGARIVICGRPNVGKSTLLNLLLENQRSIVTHVPGTTRDTIEEQMVIQGIPVRIVDTAGLRDSECIVEQEGIQRAQASVSGADIILYVIDGASELAQDDLDRLRALPPQRTIMILNKEDLPRQVDIARLPDLALIPASLRHGDARPTILNAIVQHLGAYSSTPPHAVLSERHRNIVQSVLIELNASIEILDMNQDEMVALAASRLRYALDELGRATGRTYSNELLDNIFQRFCVGK